MFDNEYPAISSLTRGVSTEISQSIFNIPLWEGPLLGEVFEQLQAIRPYYDFSVIATDRYIMEGSDYQVNIATREMFTQKLPAETDSWNNRHLIYTHGYGVVMKSAAQQANEPKQWLVKNLSLDTRYEALEITKPEIYYGTGNYQFAVVPNSAPSSFAKDQALSPECQGTGGLRISSLFRKLVLAGYLKEQNLIFSSSVNNNSRLLIRRNVNDRILEIAPFLKLESDPVPAIINNKIYWIVDAYTTSSRYPQGEPVVASFDDQTIEYNYIRNSVKIILDAYNGSVDFYIVDTSDPLVMAYHRAYPTLFKIASELPVEFVNHLSYPFTLFNQQIEIYSRYHQTNPNVFYQQNKRLSIPKHGNQPMQSFYLLIDPFEDKNLNASDKKNLR